jgi:[protein-PII] uridylyltransferase
MKDIAALRDAYRRDKVAVLQSLSTTGASTRGIQRTLKQQAGLVDDLLIALWNKAGFASDPVSYTHLRAHETG